MEQKCYTCKYSEYSIHEPPCCDCADHAFWMERERQTRDSKLIWSELVQMYNKALGGCEGLDYDAYEILTERFRETLSELAEAIQEENNDK